MTIMHNPLTARPTAIRPSFLSLSLFPSCARLAAALFLPLAVLAGCGGGGSDSSDTSGTISLSDARRPVLPGLTSTETSPEGQVENDFTADYLPMPAEADYWAYDKFDSSGTHIGTAKIDVLTVQKDSNEVAMLWSDDNQAVRHEVVYKPTGVFLAERLERVPGAATGSVTALHRLYAFPSYGAGEERVVRTRIVEYLQGDFYPDFRVIIYTQTFVGFEDVQIGQNTYHAARFRNETRRIADNSMIGSSGTIEKEDVWLVKDMGAVKRESETLDAQGRQLKPRVTYQLTGLKLGGEIRFAVLQ